MVVFPASSKKVTLIIMTLVCIIPKDKIKDKVDYSFLELQLGIESRAMRFLQKK